MNLLNLIFIVLIVLITIEHFISFVNLYILNNGLVFIKPENLTKTELVEKFKELSSSKSLEDLKNINKEDKKDENKITFRKYLKSYYLRLSALFFKFKNLIAKIALFTILIKYLRKIKLMRFIFRIVNYIFLSTFGIIITDIYGLKEIIAEIEYYWMEYVNFIHESKIYKTLVKIFHVVSEEDKSKVIENKSEIIENKSETKINNYELPSSGRELKNEKIIPDKTSGGNEKENWLDKDLLILGLSIVSLGLIYIYWDSIIELFNNIKPDDDGSTTSGSPIFVSHAEEYEKYFKELSTNEELYDLDVIRSADNSKIIDYSDVENTNWEDSPTTPKPSSSKLPDSQGVMLPFSKK
jgi:hypothetical protein